MERERLHEKIEKILHNMNINNLLESIDSFEFYLKQIKRKYNEIFIPPEANFQLPNQFLDLHQNNEIEKVLSSSHKCVINNDAINQIIDYLDQISINSIDDNNNQYIPNDQQTIFLINKKYFG